VGFGSFVKPGNHFNHFLKKSFFLPWGIFLAIGSFFFWKNFFTKTKNPPFLTKKLFFLWETSPPFSFFTLISSVFGEKIFFYFFPPKKKNGGPRINICGGKLKKLPNLGV